MSYNPNNVNGQATMANSSPVVISSDQSTLPVSNASLPLPTGASTAANQTTEISSLSSIVTNTTGLSTSANQTNGTQQSKITDGTNIVNVLKSDGTVAGQNAQIVSGTGMTTATLTLNAGSPATTWYDMINYPWISVEILTNSAALTLTWQTSGDSSQTNIRTMPLIDSQSTAALTVNTTTSAVGTYHGARNGRYFRVSSNASGGNTATIVITFYTNASALQTFGVMAAQQGTWSIGSNSATAATVPANAFYIGINGGSSNLTGIVAAGQQSDGVTGNNSASVGSIIYNGSTYDRNRSIVNATNSIGTGIVASGILAQFDDVSPTAITENQFGNIRMSANRNLYGTIRDAAGNERGANVNASNQLEVNSGGIAGTALNTPSYHITTNTTTTPTSSTAYISSIVISNEVGGTTSTITIQDKQGTPLKLVNGVATTALTTAPTIMNFQTPVKMVSGIDIITAGAVAATVDVWINYFQ